MDLVNQNKFKNWLIIFLLVINLITISIIWMKTAKENDFAPVKEDKSKPESVSLMKQVLSLDEEQTKQFEKLRSNRLDLSKIYNDSLSLLKKQLADELFKSKSNQELVKTKSKLIGELQTKVELIRYDHFSDLLAICTPEQKEKLKPIIRELFGRKPPKDDSKEIKQINDNNAGKGLRDKNPGEVKEDESKPKPPSIDEKLAKYSKRLKLSDEQQKKIKEILSTQSEKNKQLRKRINPDPNKIEIEKENNRKEEDDKIMQLLDDAQKKEFSKMIMKRRK